MTEVGGTPDSPAGTPAPAPSWQRRLKGSAPFRLAQAGYVTALHRLFERRASILPPAVPGHDGPARCLVLAPHPDDEVLGCGALMRSRVRAGAAVTVVVATDGRHSHRSTRLTPLELAATRREESIEACRSLGVHDVRFLGFEERTIDGDRDRLEAALTAVVADVAPDEAFVPSRRDGHVDHAVCNETARLVLARAAVPACFEYPIWFWDASSWARPGSPAWRKAVDVLVGPPSMVRHTDVYRLPLGPHATAKASAVAAYRSQTTNLTGEADWATFDRRFLRNFLDHDELFFAARPSPGRSDG